MGVARDVIEVRGLALECVVGVRPDERDREQPVRLDLALNLDLREAGRSGRIGSTCDYDVAAREVEALLRFRKYRLIESAVEETAAMLLGVHPTLQSVRVRLEKPEALGSRAETAAVAIERDRNDYPRRHEQTDFGEVEILLETREAGLYLLHVEAGRSIPRHHHQVMRELEWLVEGELRQGGRPIELCRPISWPRGAVHSYENATDRRATLFCCDCPPFIPQDEIEV